MTLKVVSGAIIAAGESLSNAVDCTGCTRLVRIIAPDDWTGGAPLSFQLSPDNSTYHDLYHVVMPGVAYNTYEVVVPNPRPGSTLTLPIDLGQDVAWLKVRSGTHAAPVVQEADREFSFVLAVPDAQVAPAAKPGKPAYAARGIA
jgi:hypothetical protein